MYFGAEALFRSLGTRANPWMTDAACQDMDPDIFFPNREDHGEVEAAKRLRLAKAACSRCPVQQECLDYAIRTNTKFGIFGNMDPKERREYAANQR